MHLLGFCSQTTFRGESLLVLEKMTLFLAASSFAVLCVLAEGQAEAFWRRFSELCNTGFGLFLPKKMMAAYEWNIHENDKSEKGRNSL